MSEADLIKYITNILEPLKTILYNSIVYMLQFSNLNNKYQDRKQIDNKNTTNKLWHHCKCVNKIKLPNRP